MHSGREVKHAALNGLLYSFGKKFSQNSYTIPTGPGSSELQTAWRSNPYIYQAHEKKTNEKKQIILYSRVLKIIKII